MNPKDQNFVVLNDGVSSTSQNLSKTGKVVDAQQQEQQRSTQPQQHKKQVRRRLHTTKPYQERLVNMAEARREIVTALKFHRASMKEASEQQKQQQQEAEEQIQRQSPQPSQYQNFEQDDGRYKSRRNPRIYPSCKTNSSNYLNKFSYPYFSHISPSVSNSYIAPPPLLAENPNFILPKQTLGLNLNFHDFKNLEITVHLDNNSSLSSSYSSGTSSSQEVPSVGTSQVDCFLVDNIDSNAATHVNEGVHGAPKAKGENDGYCDFDQPLEFPTWLNANESCLEQCSVDCFQDSTLPCMDIGDIDTVDDDWLA